MVKNNITDLSTDIGKLRCKEKKTKKALNKVNIRENLSKYLTKEDVLDSAINDMWINRQVVTTFQLQKLKK